MFDRYIIVEDSLRNIREGDEVVGFAFEARCGYYRRLILSMVEDLAVTVDGERQDRGDISVRLRGREWALDDLGTETVEAWEFGEPMTVVVRRAGGLAPGAHELGLAEQLRISYLPFPHTPATTKSLAVAS